MPELTYLHGTKIIRVPEGTVSFTVIDQAAVALIGTAPDADANLFPLDQPVGLTGFIDQINALGDTGTLKDAIANSLVAAGGRYLPKTAIVRVAEGADIDATLANVVGSAASLTGVHAFKGALSELGFKPKIYMAPGFTGQRPGDAANPVIAELAPFLERQRVMMVAGGPSTTIADAVTWRNDTGSMHVELVDPRVTVYDETLAQNIVVPPEPFVIGLGTRIIRDGNPATKKPPGFWVSWSNAEIGGITGTERVVSFDYSDPDTEATLLNENRINTIVRDQGYRYWGGLTASSDDDWMFANVVRTRNAIEETAARSFRTIIDAPMNAPQVVEAIVSLDEFVKSFKQVGAIIDGRAFFLPQENANAPLRRGQLRIEFDAEETPPIHGLSIGSRRNKKYFDVLVEDIVRELAYV